MNSLTEQTELSNAPNSERKPLMLVVDDNDAVRELVAHVLSAKGEVVTARDGVEAVNILLGRKPNEVSLLVTDRSMPRMGGDQLAAWFRAWNPHSKVLMISSDLDHAGLDPEISFLAKPFDVAALAAVARDLLNA